MLFPVNDYKPPKLPTMQEMQANPAPLKQMPSRWRNKSAVIVCAGFVAAAAMLGSCANLDEMHTQWHSNVVSEPLELRFSFGGFGTPPAYVVHLTEAEALSIIKIRLEAAGLEFGAPLPQYGVDFPRSRIESSLFDDKHNIAIVQAGLTAYEAEFFADIFMEQTDDIIFGVFYNPFKAFHSEARFGIHPLVLTLPVEAQEEARPILMRRLNSQIDEFIKLLRAKGII